MLIWGSYLERGVWDVGRDIYLGVQILASNIVSSASPPMIEAPIPFIDTLLLILRRIPLIPVQHRCLWPHFLLHPLIYLASVQSRQVVR
jgi:UDP-N-acetylmuramyl pentapeptide phosphotransferase/UDP-N-acetylglucosamine-1-phosphate transferase